MPEPNENDRPWDRDERDNSEDRPRRRRRDDDDDRPYGEAEKSNTMVIVAIVFGVIVVIGLILGGLALLLLPAVSKVRDSAARMKDSNNLKQITLGTYNYHDSNNAMPPAQEQLSWRVYILPYIEQNALAQQFDMKQSWDSPANKRFASQQIMQYTSVSDPPGTTETRYRVFVGPGTLYEPGKLLRFPAGIPDGTSNTIFVVEASELVPWPQPKELPYDRNGPLPSLGIPHRNGFLVAMADGSVRFVSDKTSEAVIRGGIEPADGKFFNP